ncbi:MAG: hypothetical protein H7Y42_11015 [Chitinophagaceae bacterium]|nr:hypothetical protein [Chitinophagaceae bacterium]
MKSDVMPSVLQMSAEELQQLMTEVQETVATEIQLPGDDQERSFGIVDMWNFRKTAKSTRDLIRR